MAQSTAAPAELSREPVEQHSRQRGEPDWLRAYRLAAWERFQALPRPTTQERGWRRTDLSGLDLDRLAMPATPGAGDAESLAEAIGGSTEQAGLLVLNDGKTVQSALSPDLAARGVKLLGLSEAVATEPDLLRPYFSVERARELSRSFDALGSALWSDGALLFVPRNVQIEAPIQVVHWTEDPGASHTLTLLVAEEGSSVTVVESHASRPDREASLATGQVLAEVGPGARVSYAHLQERDRQTWSFSSLTSRQARDSVVAWLMLGLGGMLSRVELDSHLDGQGAEADIVGLIFGEGGQYFDLQSLQHHVGSDTRSDLLLKVALRGNGRSNFDGLIRIEEQARRTSSNQENRNLLLDDQAKADSDPRLEILNSDVVRCGHGATVGPVDQEVIFYLMTRGLERTVAERLVVEGFFEPLLARVPIAGVRERLWTSIERKLGS
jgi:Fe-S cluster assembly protein SufD